ncbi:MAG: tyrosine-type recombinase/integrase [Bacteroidales bacterium]|jgi:integrase/recombinase XerC|nr:tyrosine-type recombinase/integrase [Bacteroidales bacterium]MDD4394643.1 tyrosine-type recombinase/integrase [Bacteroidales bacterium]
MNAIGTFIDYLKYEKRVSSHTVTAYSIDLQQFTDYLLSDYQCNEILQTDPEMIRSWMLFLIENKETTRTVNRKLSALRAFFRYQLKIKSLNVNPLDAVVSPKVGKRLPQFVEENEMELLFQSDIFPDNYEGWRDRLILELFYATGMRLSELINLKYSDLDLYECTVKVLGKRNKERIIPFSSRVKELLLKYVEFYSEKVGEVNKNCFIFVDSKRNKIYSKAVYRIVRKYLDMVTTIDKRSPHVLRHTFATHLLNRGADINAIKEILGHSSLAATQIYTHNSVEKLKNIYKQAHPRA